jgi:hypothetical protein
MKSKSDCSFKGTPNSLYSASLQTEFMVLDTILHKVDNSDTPHDTA